MKLGFVGAGSISSTHVRAAQAIDGVQIVAVSGRNREKTAALARSADAAAYDDFETFLAQPMEVHEQEVRAAALADAGPHRRVIEDFIRAVRSGARPACDAHEGRKSVALVEAVYESARSFRPVTVRN
jgi:predicted dehydrogenase